MNNIEIRPFKEADREELKNFKLSGAQLEYTSLPLEVLDEAVEDEARMPCVVESGEDGVVGFFVLHKHYRHEGYDTVKEAVFVRSLSINENVQGKGYGTEVAMNLPLFVQEHFSDFDHLHLVVDAENAAAWNLYERAGFIHTATKEDGPVGFERLYYLDLDRKYVSNIKLKLDHEKELPHLKVDIVLDNEEVVGYLEGVIDGETLHLEDVFVDAEKRERGIASSALRQLGTFLRRNVEDVSVVAVEANEDQYINRLFEHVGFTRFKESDKADLYIKYVKY
ncbi:GNAT family N-acetyltransferase [Salinicoccus halitifaciens]|uniref:Ribosomal protein S18 acetylase RimI-like enzyme n=1 Tax=Salinicoccus halitifaciens TaxID=1073415 RepID=A0ABV2E9B2_9STAP|nr:GNAT family N-acetyltransferase [Salinicoccus halitifaciens]MCD2138140.1 GNAT family N-acetyltransferase [Salinicoccus halitifaciens]